MAGSANTTAAAKAAAKLDLIIRFFSQTDKWIERSAYTV
jgi:hypothetical protein